MNNILTTQQTALFTELLSEEAQSISGGFGLNSVGFISDPSPDFYKAIERFIPKPKPFPKPRPFPFPFRC